MLAGVKAGFFKDMDYAIKTCSVVINKTEPNLENTEKYKVLFTKYKKIQKALEQIYNA